MNTSLSAPARPTRVSYSYGWFSVNLADGNLLRFPKSVTPTLANAEDSKLANVEMLPFTLHWPELDEDLGVESLIDLGYGARR